MNFSLMNYFNIVSLASTNPSYNNQDEFAPEDDDFDAVLSRLYNLQLLKCLYCQTHLQKNRIVIINETDPRNPAFYPKNVYLCPNPECLNHEFVNMQHRTIIKPNAVNVAGAITNNPIIRATKAFENEPSTFLENSMFDYTSYIERNQENDVPTESKKTDSSNNENTKNTE